MQHHHNPQFYTGKWKNEQGKVFCWAYKNNKVVCNSHTPKHFGFEENLYSRQHVDQKEKDVIEIEQFKKIDDKAAKVLNLILTHGINSLTTEDKTNWCIFLASLQTRHPDSIKFANQAKSPIIHDLISGIPNEIQKNHSHEIQTFCDNLSIDVIAAMSNPQNQHDVDFSIRYQDCLMNANWWVTDFSGANFKLMTSDKPVTLLSLRRNNFIYSSPIDMLNSYNYCLFLPISPTKGFFAYKGHIQPDKINANHSIKLLNRYTILSAGKQVYTNDTSQRQFIEKWLKIRFEIPTRSLELA